MKVSVVIIAKDASRTITRVLEQANKLSDDVIVLDTGSSDDTYTLARQFVINLQKMNWLGYGPTKNIANTFAIYPWILSIDADEVLSDEIIKEIQTLQPEPNTVYTPRIHTSLGQTPINFGGWSVSNHVRLFPKDLSWNDDQVHEKIILPSHFKRMKLKNKIYHFSFIDYNHYMTKQIHYAKLKALNLIDNNKKPSLLKIYLGSPIKFFTNYLWKLGILDGKIGWKIAITEAKMVRVMLDEYKRLKSLRP